jgi:hypothetical protein
MAKPFDPKAKAKRQKIIAGVLGLVLVGVLFLQAPKILGMFGGSSTTASEPAATPPPAPAAPAPATPGAPAPATPASAPTGTASLVDSDPAPVPTDGQLVTFDRFESKDPFVPQVTDDPTGQTSAPSAPSAPTDRSAKTEPPKQGSGGANSTPQTASQPVSNAVTIAVNGTRHEISSGSSFPEDDPIFRLVSLKRGTAKVGIVGGGYANGAPTITLEKGGKRVTLMNTADGTTYVLRYVG